MQLSALFVEAEPPALALLEIVFDRHTDHGTDASEGVDHNRQQRPVPQALHCRRFNGLD